MLSKNKPEYHIGKYPNDGRNWDCQCARCGSSMTHIECESCGEEGVRGHDCGEDCCCCLDPEENMTCDICDGEGGWLQCLSSAVFCEGNPLPGREKIKRGEVEWYTFDAKLKNGSF